MISPNILGSPENKLWIIGSCPKMADKTGPFTSSTGQMFVEALNDSGLTRSQVHFDYIVNEIPLKDGMKFFEKRPNFIPEQVERLKQKILQYKPNIVLCVGSEPIQYLMGVTGILKWRGHVVWDDELNTKFMCTFEPYHAWKQTRVPKKNKPGQYNFLMRNDIHKAVNESMLKGLHHAEPKYIVRPTYAQVMQEFDRMEQTGKILSYDIEILKPYEGHLMDCIGLSIDKESAICVPFFISNSENLAIPYWKNPIEFAEVLRRLKRLLESPIPKVAQNSQFDTTVLKAYYDIEVQNVIWDTMIVAHELYCDLPKDLGTLISLYTNLPYHKHKIHSASTMDRWEYCAADACANIHVMEGEKKEMCDLEGVAYDKWYLTTYYSHYMQITNPSIETCNRMHLDGVKIDEDLRLYVTKKETAILNMLDEIMDYIIPCQIDQKKNAPHKFNLNSADQKKALFYEFFNVPKIYLNNSVTVNADAMKQLMEHPNPYVAILAEICYEYRMADARLGKFKIEPDNGRIRTKYNVCGTDTGRLASGENKDEDVEMKMDSNPILPAETNLQNVQKGLPRKMFIPEEDEEFAIIDLYSAEAYLTALDAGELEMLKMLDEGIKTYQIMLEETTKLFPSEVAYSGYDYKKAKQTIHACNYGVEPFKMSMESGLPRRVAEWQYDRYHSQYPGIKERQKRIRDTVAITRWLSSPLNRRRYFVMPVGHELYNMAYAWPSQSCIGEITKIGMNKLYIISRLHEMGDTSLPWCMPNINTHDGLAIRIKKGTRDKVIPIIRNAFNVPLTLRGITIRIPIEIGFGANFNDMKDDKVYFYKEV